MDALGQEVRLLVDGFQAGGCQSAVFESGDLGSGIYLAKLLVTDMYGKQLYSATEKLLLVKKFASTCALVLFGPAGYIVWVTDPVHNPAYPLDDTGERMIPAADGEVSFVFARHEFAYRQAAQFASGKRVLDFGCGTGYGAALLAHTATSVEAVDYSAEAIAWCNEHYKRPNLSYRKLRAEDLSFKQEFDVALSFQVIEHLQNLSDFLRRLTAAVRPGGTILLTTPNARAPVRESDANPFHLNEMNFGQMHDLLSAHFRSFELLGIGYRKPSGLRSFMLNSPLYRLGRHIGRRNPIKKVARKALNMTDFAVLRSDVARDAIDLFAICATDS